MSHVLVNAKNILLGTGRDKPKLSAVYCEFCGKIVTKWYDKES